MKKGAIDSLVSVDGFVGRFLSKKRILLPSN